MTSPKIILFSGLQGCGKSTLASHLAIQLSIPIFAKDHLQSTLFNLNLAKRNTADGYHLMHSLAEEQMRLGVSCILDAVYPLPKFRGVVRGITERYGGDFRPIYVTCSDETIWRQRIAQRTHIHAHWTPIDWAEVERTRAYFHDWSTEALRIDTTQPIEVCLRQIHDWLI